MNKIKYLEYLKEPIYFNDKAKPRFHHVNLMEDFEESDFFESRLNNWIRRIDELYDKSKKHYNVNCEMINYTPILLEDILTNV